MWRERVKRVEMTPFAEAWLQRGIRSSHDVEDKIPAEVDVAMGYAAVAMGECLAAVDKIDEDVVENDLKVSILPPFLVNKG